MCVTFFQRSGYAIVQGSIGFVLIYLNPSSVNDVSRYFARVLRKLASARFFEMQSFGKIRPSRKFLNLENTVVTQCLVLKGLTPNRVYEEQVGTQHDQNRQMNAIAV